MQHGLRREPRDTLRPRGTAYIQLLEREPEAIEATPDMREERHDIAVLVLRSV